jgi:hypothetical protein
MRLPDLNDRFKTFLVGHDDIDHGDIDGVGVQYAKRFSAVLGFKNFMSGIFQNGTHRVTDGEFIVSD